MLSEMICSRCKEVVEVSATSVELPFLCDECTGAENFQDQIAPTGGLVPAPEPPPLSEILETEKGQGSWTAADGSQQIQFTTPLPSDESTATIENTTLLIADLEQQVADSKEALDKSTELIGDLTEQLAKVKENLGLYDEAGRMVTGLLLAANEERNEQAYRIEELTARLARLSNHNQQLIANNREVFDRKRHFWKKAFFYETRGFWARVFNAQYQS